MDNQIEFTANDINSTTPSMLLYKSKEFQPLLDVQLPTSQERQNSLRLNSQRRFTNINNPISRTKIRLAGYYIQPNSKNGNINDNKDNDYLCFYPVWLFENNRGYKEFVTVNPFHVSHFGYNDRNSQSQDINIFPLVESNNSYFNHKDLQFSNLGEGENIFTKAFISRLELYLIVNNCEYVGIVGSRISSGSVIASQRIQNLITVSRGLNTNYFTYRFLGFNSFERNRQLFLTLANYSKTNEYDPAIPTETWATPCPPMWHNNLI